MNNLTSNLFLPTENKFRWLCIALLSTMWIAAAVPTRGHAQTIILHSSGTAGEDGNPAKDADGTKNGIVVWAGGGVVHVVVSTPFNVGQTLEIQNGAVVKFASDAITVGGVPTYFAGGEIFVYDTRILIASGAIFTSIHDDEVGGDTDNDGGKNTPGDTLWAIRGGYYGGTGVGGVTLANCTVKYGSMSVTGPLELQSNDFVATGNIKNWPSLQYEGDVAVTNNLFKFSTSTSYLSLHGVTGTVSGNSFSYAPGATGSTPYPALWIGPYRNDASAAFSPKTGRVLIINNTFKVAQGIRYATYYGSDDAAYRAVSYGVDILKNTFECTLLPGMNGQLPAIEFDLRTRTTISFNTFTVFREPLHAPGRPMTFNQIHINNNTFPAEAVGQGALRSPMLVGPIDWRTLGMLDMERNYWGDPTGPFDTTSSDGTTNYRGKGIAVVDGIDYEPFTGGTGTSKKDFLHITASSVPAPPLVPRGMVSFSVAVDNLFLGTADRGKIVVFLRDPNGFILNQPQAEVSVTAASTSAPFPNVVLTVPDLCRSVTAEATLYPEGSSTSLTSNAVVFPVKIPPSGLLVTSVVDSATSAYPMPIRGTRTPLKFSFRYTLASGNDGKIVIDIQEKTKQSGAVLLTFPLQSLNVPRGNNQTATMFVPVDLPLRDVLKDAPSVLSIVATLRDAVADTVAGKDGLIIPAKESGNRIEILTVGVLSEGAGRVWPAGRNHLLCDVQEILTYGYKYVIATPNVTNWQIWCGIDQVFDANGNLLYTYTPDRAARDMLSTGQANDWQGSTVRQNTALPHTARKYRAWVRMIAPDQNITTAAASYDLDVRQPGQTVAKAVAAGPSQVDFAPLPVRLEFASNATAGLATAEEYGMPFSAARTPLGLLKAVTTPPPPWELIPLNRFWSVYDTLKDGSYSAILSLTYNPAIDFPSASGFSEDALVIAGLNRLSGELEPLPSTLDKGSHTVTTPYTKVSDTWVVASCRTSSVGVGETPSAVPTRSVLEQNWPNPFNGSTRINYTVGGYRFLVIGVRLSVYDLLGREVAVLVNERKLAGSYMVTFDAGKLASGVYFYRLQARPLDSADERDSRSGAGSFVQTRGLLLLK